MPLHWRKRLDLSSFRSMSTTSAWSMYVNNTLCRFCVSYPSHLPCIHTDCCHLGFQFGNTCYCNSVLQALYFCRPFREKILAYRSQPRRKENLLTCLADLFHSIANQKRKVGVIPPKKFITRLRKENGERTKRQERIAECEIVPLSCSSVLLLTQTQLEDRGRSWSTFWTCIKPEIELRNLSLFLHQSCLTTTCSRMPTSSWITCSTP